MLAYQAWLRRFDYVLHLDIHRYFLSIHLPILMDLLYRQLPDAATRGLLEILLISGRQVYDTVLARDTLGLDRHPIGADRGLPLGSYLSQWSGTFYLDGMDHYIKRVLKVQAYLRYMDDFVLFGNSQTQLSEARDAIKHWLWDQRRLMLNAKHLGSHPTSQPGAFLGYRISRGGITPRRKLRRRMKQRIRLAAAQGPDAVMRCVRSYRGLLLF